MGNRESAAERESGMRTRAEKPVAQEFPVTPEHPSSMNAELQYRLEAFRLCDCAVAEAGKIGERTQAWRDAMFFVREWLLKGARESIDALGPISSAAQKATMNDFVKSLERSTP